MKIFLVTTGPNSVIDGLSSFTIDIIDLGHEFLDKPAFLSTLHSKVSVAEQEILVTYRCPYIIPEDIRDYFKLCINIHPLSLPEYAGLNPWPKFMKSGEKESEVVIHEMTDSIDNGTVIATMKYEKGKDLAYTRMLADAAATRLILDTILSDFSTLHILTPTLSSNKF